MTDPLAIDDKLLDEAQRIGRHRTRKGTVNAALREYIRRRRQTKAVDLFGKIDFDPEYDYKKAREKR
jgi:hypothetical protein